MVDDVLKVVAQNKISELEGEKQKLKVKLEDEQSFNRAAWAEYGSELCGGGMVAIENAIREDIVAVERKITLLRRFVDGDLDISREGWLNKCSAETAGKIVTMQDSKILIDEELSEITKIKNLLALN